MAADETPKPPMTHQEASWHAMLAGQAAATGGDGETTDPAAAVAEGAAGGIEVEGVLFPPPCAGSVLVIESLADLFSEAPLKSYDQVALIVWAFKRPVEAYRLVVQEPDADAVLRAARACLAPVPMAAVPRLRDWVLAHMSALSGDPAEKKSQEAKAKAKTSSKGSSPSPAPPHPERAGS